MDSKQLWKMEYLKQIAEARVYRSVGAMLSHQMAWGTALRAMKFYRKLSNPGYLQSEVK